MTEEGPREAEGGKRGIRTALLKARAESATDTVSMVAGELGPRVRMSHAGERMVRPPSAVKPNAGGRPRGPAAFVHVRSRSGRRHDRPRRKSDAMEPGAACADRTCADPARDCGGIRRRSRCPGAAGPAVPGRVLKAMGVFSPDMREIAETLYQFDRPFVMDSTASEMPWGCAPTPLTKQPPPRWPGGGTWHGDGGCGRGLGRLSGLQLPRARLRGGRQRARSAASVSGRPSLPGHQIRGPIS